MGFLIRRPGQDWQEPLASSYSNEAELQDLLASAPSLLPGDDPLVVIREFWIPGVGSADLVGISATGDVVIVECKLKANPQIRREVVGQALAYAGGLWQMPVGEFVAQFEAKTGSSFDKLVESLGDADPSDLRTAIEAALNAGDFRVVIAVDEITDELRSIVEYLNGHTTGLEVMAIELAYTKDEDIEILVPTVFGLETATAKKATRTTGKKWTLASIRESIDDQASADVRALCGRILDHGVEYGARFHFGSGQRPGMSCYYLVDGEPTSLWALYPWEDDQTLAASIGAVAKRSPELAQTYLDHLRMSDEIAPSLVDIDNSDLKKYPTVSLTSLSDADIDAWIGAIDSVRDH